MKRVDTVSDGGLLVNLGGEVDLDLAMLEVARAVDADDWPYDDLPTCLPVDRAEPWHVGWARKSPCHPSSCWDGGSHAWHTTVGRERDPEDTGRHPGWFMGLVW